MYFNWFCWILRAWYFRLITFNRTKFKYFGKPISILGLSRFKIEKNVAIYPGSRIEILDGILNIGENTRIGHNFFCESSGGKIIIGKNVTISANCFLGATDYDWKSNEDVGFKNKRTINRDVIIGDNVFIGFGVCILPGSIIKKNAVVGANVVVSKHQEVSGIYTGQRL